MMDKIHKSLISGHTALVYEDICRERMWNLNFDGHWPFRFSRIGRWWDKQSEIAIAAIDPKGNNLILGECKYWTEPVGIHVLHRLEVKSRSVDWRKGSRHVWYVLFSASGFTEELISLAKAREDVLLIDEPAE